MWPFVVMFFFVCVRVDFPVPSPYLFMNSFRGCACLPGPHMCMHVFVLFLKLSCSVMCLRGAGSDARGATGGAESMGWWVVDSALGENLHVGAHTRAALTW